SSGPADRGTEPVGGHSFEASVKLAGRIAGCRFGGSIWQTAGASDGCGKFCRRNWLRCSVAFGTAFATAMSGLVFRPPDRSAGPGRGIPTRIILVILEIRRDSPRRV